MQSGHAGIVASRSIAGGLLPASDGLPLMQDNMLFAGTAVANGSCLGIVNAIGMSTEVGKIQQQITEAAAEEEDTPLKKKLDVFGERLAQVVSRLQANLQEAGID